MKITIDEVAARLEGGDPWLHREPAKMTAAVALILRQAEGGLEALFIRRAEHEQDPWSGHLAFPGGRVDPEDAGPREAAIRETLEEVNLDLLVGRPLGRLSDVLGHAESIRVSGFVYGLADGSGMRPNYEIQEAFWTPLADCIAPRRQVQREFRYMDESVALPAIRLLDDERAPVLWGITYKFLENFLGEIGRPIPEMPWSNELHGAGRGPGG